MQPHEVVRQVSGTAVQPGIRPHSRQITPTSRANGRFMANTNPRRAFEEERPMISKAQVLKDLSDTHAQSAGASTPPPAVRGLMVRAMGASGHSHSAGPSPLSPARPATNGGGRADRTPTRMLGKALINSTNILPEEIASKAVPILSASYTSAGLPPRGSGQRGGGGSLSATVSAGGGAKAALNFNASAPARTFAADFEVSLDRTSPTRAGGAQQSAVTSAIGKYRSPARGGAFKLAPPREDEVVLPGSTITRSGPDRAGFKPQTPQEVATGGRSPSPLAGGASARPLTPVACTMPVVAAGPPSPSAALHSPSRRGVRALHHVQQSREAPDLSAQQLVEAGSEEKYGSSDATQQQPSSAGDDFFEINGDDVTMAQLLASYGVTSEDCIPTTSAFIDEGVSIIELAQREGVQANLKTMALNQKPPANTFNTLVPPKMACNDKVFILCTPGTGSQTRSVPFIEGATANTPSATTPTKGARGTSLDAAAQQHLYHAPLPANIQHHLIIDLSAWPMMDHGPAIIVPCFKYKAGVEDHNIDRSLAYHIALGGAHAHSPDEPSSPSSAAVSSIFSCGTPVVGDSERGSLILVPNPGACGSATFTVFLEDNASVDPKTGLALRSAPVTIYIHTLRTENTAANPASNADGTPHPPLSTALPAESAAKIITPTPAAYAAVPVTSKAIPHVDSATGETSFVADPKAKGSPPTNLHAPYTFPLPNLFEIREDSCFRDQLQGLLERTQAAAEAFDEAAGTAVGTSANIRATGRLDSAFPFSAVVAPCYRSIATPFEAFAALAAPTQWRASPANSITAATSKGGSAVTATSEAAAGLEAAVRTISFSHDEGALTAQLKAIGVDLFDPSTFAAPLLSSRTTASTAAAPEIKEVEVCALLSRISQLAQAAGRGEDGQRVATAACEVLTVRRAAAVGFSTIAEVGTKEPILQSGRVKDAASEQAETADKCELLIDALLSASRCFSLYGRFGEALEAAETAARAADRYIGKDSAPHLSALVAVGLANGARGDYVAAARSLESAVDIAEMVNGSTSAATALIVGLLGASYCEYGDTETGISCLQRAQRTFATILSSRVGDAAPSSTAAPTKARASAGSKGAPSAKKSAAAGGGGGGEQTPMLVTDLKLRVAFLGSLISYWRCASGAFDVAAPSTTSSGKALVKGSPAKIGGGKTKAGQPDAAYSLSVSAASADINASIAELISVVSATDDAIYQHQLQQHAASLPSSPLASAASATAGGVVDEALAAPNRLALVSFLHSVAAALLLSKRESRAVHHLEEAARFMQRAVEEAEDSKGLAEEKDVLSLVPRLKLLAAASKASTAGGRLTANEMFDASNEPFVESAVETIEAFAGERHPFYCRCVALLGQLTRFSDPRIAASVHATMLRTREAVRSVMCLPCVDASVIAACCALTALQQADPTATATALIGGDNNSASARATLSGPQRAERLRLAVEMAVEAVDVIAACDALYGNTAATEHVLEFVVEPACLAVFSAVQEPLPALVAARLDARIASIRDRHGDTSPRLMEPLLNFGVASYLNGNYQAAHHFLAKSLKVADTINLIFLLGHLFKPTVHLTASQAQERNRVAGDRLQIHQSVQFATILFAIAGVYVAQGNADDAQSTYLQAQAALELAHMQTSLATGKIIAALARFLYAEGHYGDAMAHAEKAYALVREFHISVGSDSHNKYSVVPTAGVGELWRIEQLLSVINERTHSKGYTLGKQYDGRHRFVVYL